MRLVIFGDEVGDNGTGLPEDDACIGVFQG